MRLYIGLLHYPVYNKNDEKIASAITNFDLHDLSRLARTYGVKRFFVITPLDNQQKLAERILHHWTDGYGAKYNSDRKEAIELIEIVPSLDSSVEIIREIEGEDLVLIATDALKNNEKSITFKKTIELLHSDKIVFIIFGTAWGIHKEILNLFDYVLDPIEGPHEYNHLSVRTAAGIILDRLIGRYN